MLLPAFLASKTAAVIKQIPGTTPIFDLGGSGGGTGSGSGGGGSPTVPGATTYPATGPTDSAPTPPPPAGGATNPPGSSAAAAVHTVPTATLAETAGRLVLPTLIALCVAAVAGGLMLMNAGSDGPGVRATVRGWLDSCTGQDGLMSVDREQSACWPRRRSRRPPRSSAAGCWRLRLGSGL